MHTALSSGSDAKQSPYVATVRARSMSKIPANLGWLAGIKPPDSMFANFCDLRLFAIRSLSFFVIQ